MFSLLEMSSNTKEMRTHPRWRLKRILNSTYSHTKSTATDKTISSEDLKTAKQLNSSFLTNSNRATSRWVGEAEILPCQKYQPPVPQPIIEKDVTKPELLPKERGVHAHIRYPKPWDLQWKHEPHKISGFENQRRSYEKTQRIIQNRDTSLKGLACRLNPGISMEVEV